jgi:hypothetical protein
MSQLHNMTARVAQKHASASLRGSGNCVELEGLTKTRGEAFTEYLSARHHLSSCSESDIAAHSAAVETFEVAHRKFRVSQRDWERHVSAHHMG